MSGGRTEVFKIYFDSESEGLKGRYLDFNSLYPFVQKYNKYPIGRVEFLNGDQVVQNIDKYFGVASVQIEAPSNLKIPVLPFRSNNKLMFPLCSSCALEKNNKSCNHASEKRDLFGCWVTEELKLAVRYGYKI